MENPSLLERPAPRLLKAAEVARILNISRSLSYRLMQTGVMPIVRINNAIRVTLPDLEEYIRRSRFENSSMDFKSQEF
jgi:excisionase family DNA binding protein